jgi:hypothetical protein
VARSVSHHVGAYFQPSQTHLVPLLHLTERFQTQSILEMFMVCCVLVCADVRLVDPVDPSQPLTAITCIKILGTGNHIVLPHLHVGFPGCL